MFFYSTYVFSHPSVQAYVRALSNSHTLHIQLLVQSEKQQGTLKPESLLQEALLLWESEGAMVNPETEPHLVRNGESPGRTDYAQHTGPGSCCPERP